MMLMGSGRGIILRLTIAIGGCIRDFKIGEPQQRVSGYGICLWEIAAHMGSATLLALECGGCDKARGKHAIGKRDVVACLLLDLPQNAQGVTQARGLAHDADLAGHSATQTLDERCAVTSIDLSDFCNWDGLAYRRSGRTEGSNILTSVSAYYDGFEK